ncbi:cytochrome P450 [Suillus bovinus]|uniref:cytochrome P450 n=1 Tax=Suillus bovinus TaxID=48563 RepID=UPI001B87052E|nr:cytochrome P450 [Suillus bovinus]KAG2127550.1 cytochrome P450 [Suillus bovinus]
MANTVDGHLAILAGISLSFVAVTAFGRFIKKQQNNLSLPPGPVPLPLLGNVLSVDTQEPWLTYTEWGAAYGDLVFVRILDQEIVVVNSQHIAEALLDKRSRIYSDRPYLATLKPYGLSISFTFMRYGDEWRRCRRLFHQTFRPESAVKFRPMQIRRARELVVNLVDDPQHYHDHFATFSLSVVMSAVYDYDVIARDDPLVQIVVKALASTSGVLTPETALLLKTFPFLLKIPDWCWGSSIKRNARASTERINEMVNVPFRYAQQHIADSPFSARSSMVAENLRRMETQDEAFKPVFEDALKKAACTTLGASYETTSATLMVFVLAMVLYPDVQKRAQAEIDLVVGRDRLPTFEDRASLPYIDAVVRETFRWQPVVPLGIPHATLSDDVYDGYFIPKGTIVTYNTWGITRDEKRHPDASRFIPERFIDVDGALTTDDPAQYIFGFGRRICPGRYIADASAWSAIVTMLATLDISSAKDDQGRVINFTPIFMPGVVRYLTFLVPVYPFVTNSLVISAVLRSSLAVFWRGLILIQTLWTAGELPKLEDDSIPIRGPWPVWGTRGVINRSFTSC